VGNGKTTLGTRLPVGNLQMRYVNACVRAARKHPRVVRVTINARVVANKNGTLDVRGRDDRAVQGGTGDQEQRNNNGPRAQERPSHHAEPLFHCTGMKDGDASAAKHRHFLSERTRARKYGFPRLPVQADERRIIVLLHLWVLFPSFCGVLRSKYQINSNLQSPTRTTWRDELRESHSKRLQRGGARTGNGAKRDGGARQCLKDQPQRPRLVPYGLRW
jgi:hypothetical protein